MKKLLLLIVTSVSVAGLVGVAQSEAKEHKNNDLLFASSAKATFKEVVPGVSKAAVWGDEEKGPYGAFTKFKAGQDNGMHTHTHDIWIVGIKGAYVYRDEQGEKRVGAGDFIRIPGGTKHWSGGDAKKGALFYEESNGKFDLVPAK